MALAGASRAFYDDHGRWPRDLDELESKGFARSRVRAARFKKRVGEGGVDIHYTPRTGGRDPVRMTMYLPPPREWSPKGARTQPSTAPAE
jgi:hypothetical protein